MNIEYVGRKGNVTDPIRDLTDKKLAKIGKYFDDIISATVEIDQERHLWVVEVAIKGKDFDARSTGEAKELSAAINEAADKLEVQARRSKRRLKGRRRRDHGPVPDWSLDVIENSPAESGEPRIIRTSMLQIKPMSIDEARLQLESSKHDFVVFLNSSSDRVNVLYRRADENLGLITPEL